MKGALFKRTGTGVVAVLLLLAAALLACRGVLAVGDLRLLNTAHSRTLAENELAPRAEALPLVTALWEMGDAIDPFDFGYDAMAPCTAVDPALREGAMDELYRSGILPTGAEEDAAFPLDDGAREIAGIFLDYCGFVLYRDTTVVRARVTFPAGTQEGFDLDAAFDAYLAHLKLAGLDDWQPAQLATAATKDERALYSSDAQLLVQLVQDEGVEGEVSYTLGAYPYSREAFRQKQRGAGPSGTAS